MEAGPKQFIDWMARRGFNQRETADFFGWDETFISMLRNGKRQPGLENAVRIERETGIPVEAWLSSTEVNSEPAISGTSKKLR